MNDDGVHSEIPFDIQQESEFLRRKMYDLLESFADYKYMHLTQLTIVQAKCFEGKHLGDSQSRSVAYLT